MTKSVEIQMEKIFDEYSKEVREVANEAAQKVAKECVQKLRNTSPRDSGDYAKSWDVKKKKSTSGIDAVIVHNRKHYQLTHLLENGHVVRNKKGTYGRARPIKHIEPVEEWANGEFQREVEGKL